MYEVGKKYLKIDESTYASERRVQKLILIVVSKAILLGEGTLKPSGRLTRCC